MSLLLLGLGLTPTAFAASVGDEGGPAVLPAPEVEAAQPAAPRRRALIVGANDGGSSLEQLRYAESDAERMAEILGELGGFEADDLILLPSPTAAELDDRLADLSLHEQDLFLFYYSGHADARGLQLGEEIYGYDRLKDAMRGIDAEVRLGVLDACRSGAVTTVKGASVEAPFLVDRGQVHRGEAWIAASSASEDAQESPLLGGSFFTYYLLSGLRGAADTGDGWVSLNEAYSYAYDRTVARTAGTAAGAQHPAYQVEMEGNGELWLTDVRRATARLRLPKDSAGTVTVLSLPDERPVAEVAKLEGREVSVAVPPGRYLLRRRLDGKLQEVRLTVTDGSAVTVDRWGDAREEVATVKGGPGFVEEDGRRYVKIPVGFDPSDLPKVDPWHSPAIAGLASAILPGAGQVYDKRLGHGALFFTGTVVLNGIGWGMTEETRGGVANRIWPGPNLFTWLGAATYFWSITDAAHGVHRRTGFRPRTGVLIGAESAWGGSLARAETMGLSIDVVPIPGVGIGLDRLGGLPVEGGFKLSYGGRLTLGPELERARPEFELAAGMISTHPTPESPNASDRVLSDLPDSVFKPYWAAGGAVRVYLSPRYFIRGGARLETSDLSSWQVRWSGGMGFHVGGIAPRRSGDARPVDVAPTPADAPAIESAPAPAVEPESSKADDTPSNSTKPVTGEPAPGAPTDLPQR